MQDWTESALPENSSGLKKMPENPVSERCWLSEFASDIQRYLGDTWHSSSRRQVQGLKMGVLNLENNMYL